MFSIALFLVFVALAVYAQNLTGFALALILLGLVGATDLYPLPDVVNIVSIIALVNATIFLYKRRALTLERALWPALLASFVGTVLGVMALSWIVGNAYELLRLLLGASIIYCAWILWRRKTQLKTASPPSAFVSVGLISGLMGGLFSAGGPAGISGLPTALATCPHAGILDVFVWRRRIAPAAHRCANWRLYIPGVDPIHHHPAGRHPGHPTYRSA